MSNISSHLLPERCGRSSGVGPRGSTWGPSLWTPQQSCWHPARPGWQAWKGPAPSWQQDPPSLFSKNRSQLYFYEAFLQVTWCLNVGKNYNNNLLSNSIQTNKISFKVNLWRRHKSNLPVSHPCSKSNPQHLRGKTWKRVTWTMKCGCSQSRPIMCVTSPLCYRVYLNIVENWKQEMRPTW